MFYHIFYPLSADYSFLNVFRYITFRSAWAGITALALSLLIAPYLIRYLQKLEIGEKIRDDGPERHLSKAGTPTMGGLLILFSFVLSTLLWANLSNPYIWVVVFVAVGFGSIGLYDDVLKFRKGDGLSARGKILLQPEIPQRRWPQRTRENITANSVECRCGSFSDLFRSDKRWLRKPTVCSLL
jgi:phospho-N-acetylmuramoyl-pentapeptide-transferase